jgi:hypothetical protein
VTDGILVVYGEYGVIERRASLGIPTKGMRPKAAQRASTDGPVDPRFLVAKGRIHTRPSCTVRSFCKADEAGFELVARHVRAVAKASRKLRLHTNRRGSERRAREEPGRTRLSRIP